LGCVHKRVVRLGGAGCHGAQGFDERGELGLDSLRIGVVRGHALGFDEIADSFDLILRPFVAAFLSRPESGTVRTL
jgi:hypothetical protein